MFDIDQRRAALRSRCLGTGNWGRVNGAGFTFPKLGKIGEGSTIVYTLTGHGLKDIETAITGSTKPVTVDAELRAIERVIRQHLK